MNMDDKRIKKGPLFGFENFENSLFIQGVRGQPVNSFGWYGNQLARRQKSRRLFDIFTPGCQMRKDKI